MGPLSGAGDPQRFHAHRERIYIFASDQCRAGFQKRPDAFLATDEAKPADAEAIAAGRLLVERAAAAHGGVERLRAWRSAAHERERKNGDVTERWRTQLRLPGSVRIDHDYVQGEQTWRYANVLDGKREVAGVAVEEVAVWCHGQVVTFGLGTDDRVATSRCRGRGPGLWFGALERVFADHREHGGLVLPGTVRGFFDGVEDAKLHEQRASLTVDAEFASGLFTAPK